MLQINVKAVIGLAGIFVIIIDAADRNQRRYPELYCGATY